METLGTRLPSLYLFLLAKLKEGKSTSKVVQLKYHKDKANFPLKPKATNERK